MSLKLPDNLFPAVLFLSDKYLTKPTIFTVLIYSTDEQPIKYIAWFNEEENIKPVTVYYDDDNKWKEKITGMETIMSKAIGIAIENYNPFK